MKPHIYNELQKLKSYIDFVNSLPENEGKENAKNVNAALQNIDKPSAQPKEWGVCINIFDFSLANCDQIGIYNKRWSVRFESGCLEIDSYECHIEEDGNTREEQIQYTWVAVDENQIRDGKDVVGDLEIDNFIADALKFRSHIIGDFKDVEAEIYADL